MKTIRHSISSLLLISALIQPSAAQWSQAKGPYGGMILSFVKLGSTLFAGTKGFGVFRSTNNGVTWESVGDSTRDGEVTHMTAYQDTLFAVVSGSLLRSADHGLHWTRSQGSILSGAVRCIETIGTELFLGADPGIYRSTDHGTTWINAAPANNFIWVSVITSRGKYLFNYNSDGLFRSADNGSTWQLSNSGMIANVNDFLVYSTTIYAATVMGVYMSINDGATWSPINGIIPTAGNNFKTLGFNNLTLYLGTTLGVYQSGNFGSSWGGVGGYSLVNKEAGAFLQNGSDFFIGTREGGIYRTTDNGTYWTHASTGLPAPRFTSFASVGDWIFCGTDGAGVFRSSDNGGTWEQSSYGLTNAYVSSVAAIENTLFAATNNGVYRSVNNGLSWSGVSSGLPSPYVGALTVLDGQLFACLPDAGVYSTVDLGDSWGPRNTGIPSGLTYTFISNDSVNLYVGLYHGSGFFRSTDKGLTWTPMNPAYNTLFVPRALAVMDSAFVARSMDNGLYRSTNQGVTWKLIDPKMGSGQFPTSLYKHKRMLFAGATNGVFRSTDAGISWEKRSDNLGAGIVSSMIIHKDQFLAGVSLNGVWRHSAAALTGVSTITERSIPGTMTLEQNFPNPFNPTTTITVHIPRTSPMTLIVYDVLGREIETLYDDWIVPGSYTFRWDAAGISSGMYIARLSSGDHHRSIKLLLQR